MSIFMKLNLRNIFYLIENEEIRLTENKSSMMRTFLRSALVSGAMGFWMR